MNHHRPLVLFVLTLATIATAVVTGALSPRRLAWLPAGFERPVLAIELVASNEDFNTITRQSTLDTPPQPSKDLFRRGTIADFFLIVAYGLLWACIPLAVPTHERRVVRYATAIAVAIGVVADVVENAGVLRGLAGNPQADLIRTGALVKWAALGVAYVAMIGSFWPDRVVRDGWQLWNIAIGLLYGYAGVLSLLGVFASHGLVERVGLPIGLALVMQTVAFWRAHRVSVRTAAQVKPLGTA